MNFLDRVKETWRFYRSGKTIAEVGHAFSSWLNGTSSVAFGWQFKAAKLLGETVGYAAFRLYRIKADGSWSEIDSHPALDLLHQPNPISTHSELLEMLSMSLDFYGNGYLYMDGADSPTAKPKALYFLKPQNVTIVRTDSFPESVIAYKYRHKSREYVFQPHQILHIRESNPDDPILGFGAVQAMSDSVDLDLSARQWNRAFFRNSARPDLILKSKFKTREQMDPIRMQFEDRYRGTENAHKVAILPDGVEPDKMGWSQKEMDFVEQLKWSRDDILSGLRTPHVVLGLGAGENLNRATAEATNYIYALRTVMPRLRRIATFLNVLFIPRFGKDLVIEFDNVVPEDEDLAIKKRIAALGGSPYESVNEVRDELGLEPIENGDSVMASFTQTPVGSPKVQPNKTVAPRSAYLASKEAKRINESNVKVESAVSSVASKAADGFVRIQKVFKLMQEEARWRAFVKRVTPYEKLIKKTMADYAQGMVERASTNLEEQSKAFDLTTLLDPRSEVRIIVSAVRPIFDDLYRSEGRTSADLIGGAFDDTTARVHQAVNDAVGLMAETYQEETTRLLRDALRDGLDAGEGIDKLKNRISDIGEFSSDVRAERVAKTEAFRVANMAGREAYRQSGVQKLVWYTAADELVCEFCAPLHGTVVGIDENFYDKGDVVQGSEGGTMPIDYADVTGGALHPNCRCQVVPQVEELQD